MTTINNLNYKITKLFQNPNINFFIIMLLILLISCYTFINISLKYMITSFVSNQIVILFILITIILIGFYNINIAILVLLLLFIILYSTSLFNNKNVTKIEGFTNNDEDFEDVEDIEDFEDVEDVEDVENFKDFEDIEEDYEDYNSDSEDEDDNEMKKNKLLKSFKDSNDNKQEETISKIKNSILGNIQNIKEKSENDYKKSLAENKQIQYHHERKLNKQKQTNSSDKSKSKTNSSKKENFQTVKTRKFDPSKEEDTNLLITKEILQDMINRIEYNFESNKYLKKYVKHRIEEIVELNKLLNDDD